MVFADEFTPKLFAQVWCEWAFNPFCWLCDEQNESLGGRPTAPQFPAVSLVLVISCRNKCQHLTDAGTEWGERELQCPHQQGGWPNCNDGNNNSNRFAQLKQRGLKCIFAAPRDKKKLISPC